MAETTPEQDSYLSVLEDKALMLQKAQTNLKKCPKSRLSVGYLKARLEVLEDNWQRFRDTHEALIKCTPREKRDKLPYFTNEDFYTSEDIYLVIKAEILDIMSKLEPTPRSEHNTSTRTSMDNTLSAVRLPRIQLPTFSGRYEEFPTYEDLFTSMVHTNASLSDVQKLHYLKSSISGEPEALLRHIQITDANYTQAWELLKGRYGNKRVISTSVFKRLFYQKKMVNQSATHIKTLLDTTSECLNSLNNLGICTESWDTIIIFLVVQKLDIQTHKEWEEQAYNKNSNLLPTWENLQKFLEAKFRTLELVMPQTSTYKERSYTHKSYHSRAENIEQKYLLDTKSTRNSQQIQQCTFCKEQHFLFNCKDFAKEPIENRQAFVRNNNLCFNCLVPNHRVFECRYKTSCRICKKKHHSLLHKDEIQRDSTATQSPTDTTGDTTNIAVHYSQNEEKKTVLLATAQVNVVSSSGETYSFRALIDQGSEASFITPRIVDLLKLKKHKINCTVSGVGEENIVIKHEVKMTLLTNTQTPIEAKAYVMKAISSKLPAKRININWSELNELKLTLADQTCCEPSQIDLLLGVDIFCKIIQDGLVKLQDGLIAQNTTLGWIISGQTKLVTSNKKITSLFIKEDNDMLKRFWELETETYTKKKILTKEEEICETIYKNTTQRNKEGRYIVHLPLKQTVEDTIQKIGDTKQQAIRRFKQLERRFEKNTKLKEEYTKVIQEYIDMKHMTVVNNINDKNSVYLPHHAIIREDKETTKVRVVYDASAKGDKGLSLNDTMLVGPVLQSDLRSLIIRWRQFKICIIGDIVKMYRMVEIADEHKRLQCIVWRDKPEKALQTYQLQTVTFGTAAAPYLAVRTLNQLADDESHLYPNAAVEIKNSFYMDDLMTGADDIETAKSLCAEIKRVLSRGGFIMQKWSSNSDELLECIQQREENHERNQLHHNLAKRREVNDKIEIKMDKIIKILGLTWDRKEDKFKITVNLPEIEGIICKRSILSDVARLFDPFGWLSPVVISAKTMIQKLWLCNLGWDDELPENLKEEWITFRKTLTYLQDIEIPRWLHTTTTRKEIELHGFADASTMAYAAVTYLKIIDEDEVVHISIIASRSKVAPLKQLTVPRLELCAAVLLTELITDVADLLNVKKENIFAYTDSMVVLSWLQSQPHRWQTFVANRVAEILRVLDNQQWRHIPSTENPADIATRGINAGELANHNLWWTGPMWLRSGEIDALSREVPETNLEEKRSFTIINDTSKDETIWTRFSTISRMKRVLAYCRRFLRRKDNKEKIEKYLTAEELENILQSCIKFYQRKVYESELQDLNTNGRVKKSSTLITLSPFLDENNIIKVGGRLQNAAIIESAKHPIIIPRSQHITKLLIQEAHVKTLHGGIQAMMAYIRTRYWIVGVKSAVKKCITMCKVCVIDKAKVQKQFMGQLPTARVNASRPFMNSGVDYAGPVKIRPSKGRGIQSTKGYICLFVCMATKAVHLEAVTDLTTQGFLAAFRRFVSRRGPCAHLWSDNGTNFVGAAKELRQLFAEGKANVASEVAELLSNDGTIWHFIPPKMPNYGGLWEAGVKSTKRHLQRVIGTSTLTYEEMSTLLAQIEAVLNSRPLCQLDNTTETLDPLTPGHLLVGQPLVSVPDVTYKNININLLTRWQIIQKMTQDFWSRWQHEYLNTLQQRYKWQETIPAPCVGDIVVIKDYDLPPSKWLLGKIVALYPGADSLVRVVLVQCKGNQMIKRPLSKLILLPKDP